MEADNCKCCGTDISETAVCAYCGNWIIIDIDGTSKDRIKAAAEKHRKKLLSQLTDFSVETFQYKFQNNEYVQNGKKTLKIADGVDCSSGVKWAKENLARVPNSAKQPLNIRYRFNGNQKSVSVLIETKTSSPGTAEFWKLGVRIGENLRLNVYIGDESDNVSFRDIALDFN
jgi:hypothetical protein